MSGSAMRAIIARKKSLQQEYDESTAQENNFTIDINQTTDVVARQYLSLSLSLSLPNE